MGADERWPSPCSIPLQRREQRGGNTNVKNRYASLIVIASIASLAGCIAPTSSSEDEGATSEAITSGGLTASLTVTGHGSQTWAAVLTVTNNGDQPASNWQVALNMGPASFNGSPTNFEALEVGGQAVITPGLRTTTLNPGASVSDTINAVFPSGSANWTPSIVSLDGVALGTVGNPTQGWPTSTVDMVARSVATGALNLAMAYENDKLPTNGDSNYGNYDGLIWSSQSYIISNGKMAFDPNVPGYNFIPVQAMAALDAMQDSPEVTSYLTAGLASCFADSSGSLVYNFKAGVLKNFVYPGSSKPVAIGGGTPAPGSAPGGYNPNTVTDSYTTAGASVNGAEQITVTLTGARTVPDYWFGVLTASSLQSFPNTQTVASKFKNGNGVSCSPFNGPGGSANPYFTMSLNGKAVAARFQGIGAQCQNGCTSTLVVDPDAYATPGAYYNTSGLVGPQPNPFGLDPAATSATPDHQGQWSTSTDQYGNTIWGTFSVAIAHRGVITNYGFQQMGTGGH
jgi:hypothetical protein